jgi:hypothetical protein
MNIEILFRDGTKLKLVGYNIVDKLTNETFFTLEKNLTKEMITINRNNMSYIHTKEE